MIDPRIQQAIIKLAEVDIVFSKVALELSTMCVHIHRWGPPGARHRDGFAMHFLFRNETCPVQVDIGALRIRLADLMRDLAEEELPQSDPPLGEKDSESH